MMSYILVLNQMMNLAGQLTNAGAYLLEFHRTPGTQGSCDRNQIHLLFEEAQRMLWWRIIRSPIHTVGERRWITIHRWFEHLHTINMQLTSHKQLRCYNDILHLELQYKPLTGLSLKQKSPI